MERSLPFGKNGMGAALPGVERRRLEKSKTVWVRGNWVREWEKGKNYR
ncbi:hypothetical protein [Allofournierella massiliensis]